MEGLFQFRGKLGQTLESELIGYTVFRMPALAESFELTLLAWAQPLDPSGQMGLSQ